MTNKIYFIRHAESRSNAGFRTSSANDNPITENGQKQAIELSKKIMDMNLNPSLIIHSPYIRTLMTAEPTIKLFPTTPVEEWECIHEFNYLKSSRCTNTTQQERKPFVDKYWSDLDPYYSDGENAESFVDFVNRIKETVQKLKQYNDKTVFVFTHGQFIAMTKILLENPNEDIKTLMKLFCVSDRGRVIDNCQLLDFSEYIN